MTNLAKFAVVVAFFAFTIATFIPIYTTLTAGSTDLYPSWIGAKMFFEEGISPYDDRVGVASQLKIYGRLTQPGEDQMLFVYPFYGVLYIGPLVLVEYELAAAIYIEIMLLSLLLALVLCLHTLRWLPSPVMLATLLLGTLVGYFSVRGLLLAQWAIIGYIGHIVALWSIYKGYDKLAGLGLVLSTIKPQTGYLLVPLLLLWAWRFERWNILFSFIGGFGALMGLSFVLHPAWFSEWLGQIRAYESYTATLATAEIVTHALKLPGWLENSAHLLLIGLLAIPVVGFWKRTLLDQDQSEFLWGYCLTLTFSLTVAPRTATTYYIELYPVLYLTAWSASRHGYQRWFYGLWLLGSLGYWLLHIQTVPEAATEGAGKEAPIVYVVFPIIIWGLLLLLRGDWKNQFIPLQPERI